MHRSGEDGFSLVELAIGLLVIGILTGGILKGRSLLESSRLKATITEVTNYQLAFMAFWERYQALPGDFGQASSQFGLEGYDGNQNGIVEGGGLEAGSEAVGFWQHLAAAKLIAHPGPAVAGRVTFGAGVPAAPIGGGFTVQHLERETKGISPGLWIVLGAARGNRGDGGLLTPAQAQAINKKLDDGMPCTGTVRSAEGEGVAPGMCVSGGRYNLKNQESSCVLYIAPQP